MHWGRWQWFGNTESVRCVLLMHYSTWGLLTWLRLNCWWITPRYFSLRIVPQHKSTLFLTLLLSFDQSCMLFLGQEQSRFRLEKLQNRACSHGNSVAVGLCLLLTAAEARRTVSHEALPKSGAVPPIRRCIEPNPLRSEHHLSLRMNSDDRHPAPRTA